MNSILRNLAGLSLGLLLMQRAEAAPRLLMAAESRIEFSIKQMGVTVSGVFRKFDAQIELDPQQLDHAHADVSVEIGSLSTGDDDADQIALDTPWLNRAQFPQARFVSSGVKRIADQRYEVTGTLTIRGQSRVITVPLQTQTRADGTLLASGSFTLHRADFGIGGGEWNQGDIVAKDVAVSFRLVLGATR